MACVSQTLTSSRCGDSLMVWMTGQVLHVRVRLRDRQEDIMYHWKLSSMSDRDTWFVIENKLLALLITMSQVNNKNKNF